VELLPVTGLRRVWATKMGAGLQNLGNTCYMNSVLQCLAYLPPVASGVQMNVLHGLPSSCPLAQTGKLCTCCAISKQLSDQLSTFDRAIRPVAISTALPQLSKAFVRGRQEDAHEFLLAVLEAVERDIKRGVVELGGLKDGANKYKCDRCKRLVRATKALSIHHEPNILVVHLKRFDALSLCSKISRHVDFGHTLDLAPYSCAAAAASSGKAGAKVNGTANGHGGTTSAHYVLQGLVVHQGGSLHSGHYLAYVRDGTGRFWCANDATVTASTAAEVLQQQAYLLFFSRTELRSLPPPPYVPPPPAAGVAQA
ncbi:ubiquitin carboxyl-terminal hydrolase, partial [Haematococcus lacustris]